MDIEVLPRPLGVEGNPYSHVEAAIAVIQQSGLRYEVNALGSTVEGEPDAVWALARRVHEATLAAGAEGVVTVIKVAESADPARQATMDSLTGKFRQ
jgi:uncharacterized protein YqgV (UPF0045/DUF77 family)